MNILDAASLVLLVISIIGIALLAGHAVYSLLERIFRP
jgi:hypothetical protein